MQKQTIVYLDRTGLKECPVCLEAAAARAAALGLKHAVVATTSGRTALALARALRRAGSQAQVIGVGYAANFAAQWGQIRPRFRIPAEQLGVVFIRGTHAFGGVNGAVRETLGGVTPGSLIASTYYTFGQGMKVAVEVALMAADQGVLPTDAEALALGGSGEGADTAIVLTPACSHNFFSLRIHEVVCQPRRSRR